MKTNEETNQNSPAVVCTEVNLKPGVAQFAHFEDYATARIVAMDRFIKALAIRLLGDTPETLALLSRMQNDFNECMNETVIVPDLFKENFRPMCGEKIAEG